MRFKAYSKEGYFDHRFVATPIRAIPRTVRPAYAISQKSKKVKPKLLKGPCFTIEDYYEYVADNIVMYEAPYRPYGGYSAYSGLSGICSEERKEEPCGLGGVLYSYPVYDSSYHSHVTRHMEEAINLVPAMTMAGAFASLLQGIKRLFR